MHLVNLISMKFLLIFKFFVSIIHNITILNNRFIINSFGIHIVTIIIAILLLTKLKIILS